MQAFVRIVEAGSITKAAAQLNQVKSALSKRLSELEQRLGVTLITRTTRRQTLTESGQRYYQQCIRLLDDIADVESSLAEAHLSLSGKIKLAAPLSFGLMHLGPAIRQFNDIYSDIVFDVDFSERKVDLVEEGFDLAFRIGQLEDSTHLAKRITQIRLHFCASPQYIQQYGLPKTPQDLVNGHRQVKYQSAPDSWLFTDRDGNTESIKIPSVLTANNGDFLCQAAIDGVGISASPDFICYKAVRLGQLQTILDDYSQELSFGGYVVYPNTRYLSPRVRRFIDYLSQFFGDEPYWKI